MRCECARNLSFTISTKALSRRWGIPWLLLPWDGECSIHGDLTPKESDLTPCDSRWLPFLEWLHTSLNGWGQALKQISILIKTKRDQDSLLSVFSHRMQSTNWILFPRDTEKKAYICVGNMLGAQSRVCDTVVLGVTKTIMCSVGIVPVCGL